MYYQQILYIPYRIVSYIERKYFITEEERRLDREAAERAERRRQEMEEYLRAIDEDIEARRNLQELKEREKDNSNLNTSFMPKHFVLKAISLFNDLDIKSLIRSQELSAPRITFKRRSSIYGGSATAVQPYPNADNLFDHLPEMVVLPLQITEFTFDAATSLTAAGIKLIFRL